MKITLKAPAKINWFLSVLNKRDDGYHNIVSPMQCISLYDRLIFEDSGKLELISTLDVPPDQNLVYRAALRLKEYASFPDGARITLQKDIPVAAGLGGGSSDAACTLIGLNHLWGLGLEENVLIRLAAGIGSDVPFFIRSAVALIEGRGELVTPLGIGQSFPLLLVKPDIGISAAWAYHAYAAELTKILIDIKLFCHALAEKDLTSMGRMAFNDLESAVIKQYPIVSGIKELLLRNGAEFALMSGSGPAVFGVFHTYKEAQKAALQIGSMWCRAVRTLET